MSRITATLVAGVLATGALSFTACGSASKTAKPPAAVSERGAGREAGSRSSAATPPRSRRLPPRRAAPAQPRAVTGRRRRARRRCRAGRRRRSWRAHAAAAAADTAAHDAEAGDADRLGDRAVARSARRPQGRLVGRRPSRVEHEHDLDHAADRQGAGLDAFGSGLQRQVHDPGALQRLRHLRHLESRRAEAGAALLLPGLAERRVGLQEPAVHVVGIGDQPFATAASAACRIRSARIACAASASSTSRTSPAPSW